MPFIIHTQIMAYADACIHLDIILVTIMPENEPVEPIETAEPERSVVLFVVEPPEKYQDKHLSILRRGSRCSGKGLWSGAPSEGSNPG